MGKKVSSIALVVFLILSMFYSMLAPVYASGEQSHINDMRDNDIQLAETINLNCFDYYLKSGNVEVNSTWDIPTILHDAEFLKLNTVNVPIRIDIDNCHSVIMAVNNQSKCDALLLIDHLNSLNINVIIEPYPWIQSGSVGETCWNPIDISEFFTNWKELVLAELISEIAIPKKVWGIYVASNYVHLEDEAQAWGEVFDYVRQTYEGKILYKTNWWVTAVWDKGPRSTTAAYELKLTNPLFQHHNLDIIAISCYFELTDTPAPSADEVYSSLSSTRKYNRKQNIFAEVKQLAEVSRKPIFFGEFGFTDQALAASKPWSHQSSTIVNEETQANCYTAYLIKFGREPWFKGFSVFCIGGESNFNIVGKLAGDIYAEWTCLGDD